MAHATNVGDAYQQYGPALLRNLARYAGAHVYCETNDVLMADSSVVAIHSLKRKHKI